MKSFSKTAIQLDSNDDVAIAKEEIAPDAMLQMPRGDALTMHARVPAGHKFALRDISPGAIVLRYGQPIGIATRAITRGDWVHTHNLAPGDLATEYAYRVVNAPPSEPARHSFLGYRRADGRVGTRNYVAVIATANCAANVAIQIARAFDQKRLSDFPNVGGVIPIVHTTGCGIVADEIAHEYLRRALINVAQHPNIGGAILLGFGCEVNQSDLCYAAVPNQLIVQAQGGFQKSVRAGVQMIENLLPRANAFVRTPQPISELVVALKCGGSDSWSGITANPLVGLVTDKIIAQGGTAVLAETPEIFGAEHLLLRRVASPAVAQKLIARLEWWKEHARVLNFSIDNNPSPGNKRGGLTTILEKSLGAVAKGGSTPLMTVYEYAEKIAHQGLGFMDSPGYDPVSATGLLAGGCNVMLFTTGRGSLYASNLAPTIKIASNNDLYARMPDDLDFNAGKVLDAVTMPDAAEELLRQIIAVASGERTQSEHNGLPETEFVPWQPGPIL
jgi:altronate hydrolase